MEASDWSYGYIGGFSLADTHEPTSSNCQHPGWFHPQSSSRLEPGKKSTWPSWVIVPYWGTMDQWNLPTFVKYKLLRKYIIVHIDGSLAYKKDVKNVSY